MDRKPKLAFVDHSFHKKTGSVDFMRELFSELFDVIEIWDDSWQGKPGISVDELNAGNYEYVLFFQVLPSIKDLRRLHAKLIWTPMYDGTAVHHAGFWLQLATLPVLIINFSKTLHTIAERYGIASMYLQYYRDPALFKQITDYSEPRIFFWQRTNTITWQKVKRLLANTPIKKVILKLNPDPSHQASLPSPEDIKQFSIEIIDGFLEKEQYMDLLQRCNVFIAPRVQEGIGQSFLEAIAMGMVVVGMDQPTMNEYIRSGVDGVLFTQDFAPISLENLEKLRSASMLRAKQGFIQWESSKYTILEVALSHHVTPQSMTLTRYVKKIFGTGIYYLRAIYWRLLRTRKAQRNCRQIR